MSESEKATVGHNWENLVDYGPTRVHWCRACGRVVINTLVMGPGDFEAQSGSIKRQPAMADCLAER